MRRFMSLWSTCCMSLITVVALTAMVPTEVEAQQRAKSARSIAKKKKARRSSGSTARREAGKRQAMELVRTQSAEISRMVGIEPADSTEAITGLKDLIANDGEEVRTGPATSIADVPPPPPPTKTKGKQAKQAKTVTAEDEGEDIAELEREDDVTVDLEAFRSLWLQYVDEDGGDPDRTAAGVEKQRIIDVVMDWLGTRYRFGGSDRSGIDCSAFTRMVYTNVAKVDLPRTAASQIGIGAPVSRRGTLQFGDLVFFHTRRHAYVSHVGIYLGDDLFAHASSRYGVTISSLQSTYYSKRLIGVRRITEQDVARMTSGSQGDTSDVN
ncbi:MAG: NlpC/P60 family protein [Candidatus Kapabacteria bacterium]|nr:NlpC/P60 family protein [Candidatus Kapabacteria bacterium]